jgi:hypothetical protein
MELAPGEGQFRLLGEGKGHSSDKTDPASEPRSTPLGIPNMRSPGVTFGEALEMAALQRSGSLTGGQGRGLAAPSPQAPRPRLPLPPQAADADTLRSK